ncbi:Flp family type IVb pilin [Sediminicoccus sp. KRV36]|uniref:Flp family type IVb pilin n=1 Tax=Sediminicoccus sp. KRV36 TaxID=3133721 RepID=UPI00200EDA81|nr:Flp family type IVb pilin [Sediminicoccus rosea]UPY36762.1 Flp family type IVb pilin [Sediminicoccus rosea]
MLADLRQRLIHRDEMTSLEYGLVAAFVAMAMIAAIPGLAAAISAAAENLSARFA